MITIDEELLFNSTKKWRNHEELKSMVLACISKGMLLYPCDTCQFKNFSGIMLWTSVKDALPEESGSYIVCTDKSEAFMTHFYVESKHWGGKNADKHITHWMKRPKAPKENENER